jgi:hypothetical protein
MRTTVTLDADVYEAATQMSKVSGKRLGEVLSELARRGLEPSAPSHKKKGSRFPTFQVPAGAPPISARKIQQLLDEEGIF